MRPSFFPVLPVVFSAFACLGACFVSTPAGPASSASSGEDGGARPSSGSASSGARPSSGAASGSGSSGLPSGSGGGNPAGSGVAPDAAPSSNGYHVVGNQVLDANGKPHLFHGVDRSSLEFNPIGDHLTLSDYDLMASWKANVVRIALNQGYWLQGSSEYSAGYAAVVDQQVKWAESKGLDVILDLHWSDQGNLSMKGAQQCMADVNSVPFWQQLASKYRDDGRVLFELYNEPHDIPWAVWYGGGQGCNFTVVGMQKLYDAVRATGAQNIVIVGGIDYAYQLAGVAAYPIVGNNVMYATHPYNQPPYKQPADFDSSFGNIGKTYPVIITEFGDQSPACQTSYYSAVIQYADAHALSWTGWAWYAADCKYPALISDWSATPTAAGQIEKAALLSY